MPCKFFTPTLIDGFLIDSEWELVPLGIQASSENFSRSYWCLCLDSLDSSFDL